MAALCAVGMTMFFVASHRSDIYIGSDFQPSMERTLSRAFQQDIAPGNEYVYGAGAVLNARYHRDYYWGRRYGVMLFIRPIPKQLWPTKYEDTLPEITTNQGLWGGEWLESVGWEPPRGAAPTFVADFYAEFWWLALVLSYLVGRLYGALWSRARRLGGQWVIYYVAASAVSVFIVSQTFEAWAHRLLLMSVPVALLWRAFVAAHLPARRSRGLLQNSIPSQARRQILPDLSPADPASAEVGTRI